jgi:hypothetical protein
MPEDKVIKSGQLTLPRLLFLALCGAVLFVIVASGWLNVGYLLLTGVLCVLLLLVAMDYGVNLEKVDVSSVPSQVAASAISGLSSERPASSAIRVQPAKRRTSRPAKRRR